MVNKLNKKVMGAFVLVVFLFTFASAITASIGNSRMILNLEPGETVERYILIKNTNDVYVDIDLLVTGDLANNIELEETKFTLAPETEKRAIFTVKAPNSGTSEAKVNIKFIPTEGGNSVGLASTVIVSVDGSEVPDPSDDDTIPDPITQDNETDNSSFRFNPTKQPSQNQNSFSFSMPSLSAPIILLISTSILIIILIILFLLYLKKSKNGAIKAKKESRKR